MDVTAPASTENHLLTELYDKIIQFPLDLPGFKDHKQFVLAQSDHEAPFFTLRSISDTRIGITVVEPSILVPNYAVSVDDADLIPISSPKENETGVVVVVIIEPGHQKKIKVKANLIAPIIINKSVRVARQVFIKNPPPEYSEVTEFEF